MAKFEVGHVARAEFRDGSGGEIVLLTSTGWVGTRGPISRGAEVAFIFHRLAVVDPEGGDPDTLYDLYVKHTWVADVDTNRRGMREALREYAKPEPPAPPKPDEPTKVGAVVRDAEGTLWLRAGRIGIRVWAPLGEVTNPSRWLPYSDIDAVEADVVIDSEQG